MLTREWHKYSDPSLKSISTHVIRCPCQTCHYVTNTPALAESVTNETFQQAHAAVNSNQRRATPFRDMRHCLSSGGWVLYAEDAAVRARSLTLPCFSCYLRVTAAGLECFFFSCCRVLYRSPVDWTGMWLQVIAMNTSTVRPIIYQRWRSSRWHR